MRLRSWLSREQGQSLVVVGLMLVALVGFMGLVVDVGNLYAQRRFMQNAADSGALAGARVLAMNESESAVEVAVNKFAGQNGAATVTSNMEKDETSGHVAVTVTKVVPTYFMGVLGIEANTVAAAAQAGYCPPGNPPGVMPFAIDSVSAEEALERECEVIVWDNYDGDPTLDEDYPDPSWLAANLLIKRPHRGWINLDFGSGDAKELCTWVTPNGYPGVIDVSDGGRWYPGSTGTKADVLGCLDDWVNAYNDPTRLDTYDPDNKELNVYVPVYTKYQDATTNPLELEDDQANYFITGFAMMHLEWVQKRKEFKYIQGRMIYYTDPNDDLVCGTVDYGARILQLER